MIEASKLKPLLSELDDFRRDFDKKFDEIKRKYFQDGQGIEVMLSKLPGCPISFFIDYEALKTS